MADYNKKTISPKGFSKAQYGDSIMELADDGSLHVSLSSFFFVVCNDFWFSFGALLLLFIFEYLNCNF